MDSSFSASPRRSYDIPKPETGLAEWTSKIKALQREVDADEEAEQKRLEEEIAAAREARLRRSRGMGGGSRADSLDMSSHKDKLSALDSPSDTSANDTPKSLAEREAERETSLRKLMERNDVYNPDKIAASNRAASEKAEAVSLAAFIGGRATGPRLNKHAPQQDAHDPTQFAQPDLSSPHPVFGRGGIAMPGMVTKKEIKTPSPVVGSESSERYRPTSVKASSSVATSFLEKNDQPNKKDSPDLHRHSYTGMPKSLSAGTVEKPVQKAENLPDRTKTSPVQVGFSKPKSISSSASSSLPTKTHAPTTLEPSPQASGPLDTYRSDQTLPRREQASDFSSGTKKATTSFVTNQNILSPTPKSPPLPSYLPKKEEPLDRNSSLLSKSPANVFQSNFTTSTKLPSYLGPNKTTSTVSGTGAASTSDTPLRRIMERNNVYNPDKISAEESRKPVMDKAHVSLAAFIGGNAKAPRLNRHAPQQDAHDPTQFIQPDLSAPHPIFGSGGIAMPGMTARRNTAPASETQDNEGSDLHRPSLSTKPTWPPAASKPVEKAYGAPLSPEKIGSRERTASAPDSQVPNVSASQSSSAFPSNRLAGRQSPNKDSTASVRDRTTSSPVYPQGSLQQSSRASVSTPSLARPIQPIPKSASLSPQIPITSPSPAFQKPPPPKDLTPSISRLRGRGFVQNMIKASAQFESSPSPTPSPEKSRPPSASGRKASVLDRWQPAARSSSPTKSTFPSPGAAMKRSSTQDPLHDFGAKLPSNSSNSNGVHVIKSTTSMPSLTKTAGRADPVSEELPRTSELYQRSRTPGLGSATTMVLIKPSQPQIPHVDELGVKRDLRQGPRSDSTQYVVPSEIPSSSKKPLIHPTKDRARKPRKHNEKQVLTPTALSSLTDSSPANLNEDSQRNPSEQGGRTAYQAEPVPLNEIQDDNRQANNGALNSAIPITMEDGTIEEKQAPMRAPTLESSADSETSTLERPSASPPPRSSPLPSSPVKHTRIPSTGKRPTVMELAQTLLETPASEPPPNDDAGATRHPPLTEPPLKPRSSLSQIQAEKRRSNYERYSALVLPPLKEEATPAPSPAGTLSRDGIVAGSLVVEEIIKADSEREEEVAIESPLTEEVSADNQPEEITPPSNNDTNYHDEAYVSISCVNLDSLLNPQSKPFEPPSDVQTISVEVLAITGTTAAPLSKAFDIFYETEILVIIHRVKSKSSGLASTSVWCWLGRKSTLGDREERKVHELAKRYGTKAKIVYQLAEPAELVLVLGGRLAIRQGSRMHWSPENTTMHLVRSFRGVILIDEHDLDIKNLCSAFSYCVTVLGSVYIWNGRGSTHREREAALQYATTFSGDPVTPTVLTEGQDDDDEMFWMILGDETFANADYWRWRHSSAVLDPSIWRIDIDDVTPSVSSVEFISTEQRLQSAIYIIDCVWEFFVLVGQEARSNRRAVRFALDLGKELSNKVASSRPYVPTLHVLILPSQLPLDLRHGIRDLDEAWVNDGEIPDHMNLLHFSEAVNHLATSDWAQTTLKDLTMLPLGVGGGNS